VIVWCVALPFILSHGIINMHGCQNVDPGLLRLLESGDLSQDSTDAHRDDFRTVPRPMYDIIDIGASTGGSTNFMSKALLKNVPDFDRREAINSRTLGIDRDERKVALARLRHVDSIQADICKLSRSTIEATCRRPVRGVTMWHVLEHMPACDIASDIWIRSAQLVREFSSFRGPSFDDKAVLMPSGTHRYYENWHGHTCHLNSSMLLRTIRTVDRGVIEVLLLSKIIQSTASGVLLPNGANPESHQYDPRIHPVKESFALEQPVYEEMRACVVYSSSELSILSALCLLDALSPWEQADKNTRIVLCKNDHPNRKIELPCVESILNLARRAIAITNTLDASVLREKYST
jgi:hypothetical protein